MPTKKLASKSPRRLKSRLTLSAIKSSPKRLAVLAAFALVFITGGAVIIGGSHASAANVFCNMRTTTQCLNRQGGGTVNGTDIIGYKLDWDNNEDFYMVRLSSWCSDGFVSSTNSCPFKPGSGMNTRYNNNPIVELKDRRTGKCLAASTFNNRFAALEPCGSNGYAFVYNLHSGTYGYTENVMWSNIHGRPAWLGVATTGSSVLIDGDDFGNGSRWVQE